MITEKQKAAEKYRNIEMEEGFGKDKLSWFELDKAFLAGVAWRDKHPQKSCADCDYFVGGSKCVISRPTGCVTAITPACRSFEKKKEVKRK